jgi:propionyl-CoA carboxylase alpha chain
MKHAIHDYEIVGVDTTLEFGKFAISHPAFVSGKFDTHFVEEHLNEFLEKEDQINHTLARFSAWLYEKRKGLLVLPDM